jgi:hypothetical protein
MPDLLCEWCNKDFYRKPSKVTSRHFCSAECKKNKTTAGRRKKCQRCQEPFESTIKTQFLCSRKCMGEHSSDKSKSNLKYVTTCAWCQATVSVIPSRKRKHNNFCSSKCSEAHIRGYEEKFIVKSCPGCFVEFETLYRRQKTYCSRSCAYSGERNGNYGNPTNFKGQTAWNRGLTNETSDKVAATSQKVSVALRRRFESGESTHHGDKNPNHFSMRKNKTRTTEQLNRYSLASIARVQSGCTQNPKTKKGIHYSAKSQNNIHYKSSYEETYMMFLDKDSSVASYSYEEITILYDECKRYVPDFIVTYTNGTKALVEVKGMHLLEQESTKRKLKAGEEYARSNDMSFLLITNNDILQIRKELTHEC